MVLENKLGIKNSSELREAEEKISKLRAKEIFEKNISQKFETGTFKGLSDIHRFIFGDIYGFAGKIRTVNISKGSFRFAPVIYIHEAIKNVDKMPFSTFDEIIEKYVEMNIVHPFREGNGRSMRLWLDIMLKSSLKKVVDRRKIDKEEYLSAMERSPVKDIEIKHIIKEALTDDINNREVYMKGVDMSYYYEGYDMFDTEKLK